MNLHIVLVRDRETTLEAHTPRMQSAGIFLAQTRGDKGLLIASRVPRRQQLRVGPFARAGPAPQKRPPPRSPGLRNGVQAAYVCGDGPERETLPDDVRRETSLEGNPKSFRLSDASSEKTGGGHVVLRDRRSECSVHSSSVTLATIGSCPSGRLSEGRSVCDADRIVAL